VRAIAAVPPTDGKEEETLDFKVMVHAIHAAGIRENPLQLAVSRGAPPTSTTRSMCSTQGVSRTA